MANANGHGGARRGAGRPLGAKNIRYKTSAALIEAARIDENLIPVKFEDDSLEFLRDTMCGKIWPTREQIYAAKSVLPVEYPPSTTLDRRSVEEIKEAAIAEYKEAQERDSEGYREKFDKWLDSVVLAAANEVACRLLGRKSTRGNPACVVNAVTKVLAEFKEGDEAHITEVTPAPQHKPAFRKRPSEVVDVEPSHIGLQHDCNTAAESGGKPGLSNGSVDRRSVDQLPEPRSAPRVQPIAVVAFSRPFSQFQVSSGRRFTAAEDGSITVTDEGDVEDLLRAGCRR
jgi:hypothetical protein